MNRNTSVLSRRFFRRSPEIVAPELLGKILVHHREGRQVSGRIVEVEAYLGLTDPASHAFRGRTSANDVLFGPPGIAHVYFIYGMHSCLSISCLPDGKPGGVLLRALIPLEGVPTMAKLRGLSATAKPQMLTGGPGRLCQAFGITRATHNGLDVIQPGSPLQIVNDGYHSNKIEVARRIGISKATDRPLRFLDAGKNS